ncbi:phospholipase D-like domain-containing protein [Trichocoleus desertorum AS-A10]|uniref:phospholipase D-like domain-containing protein n=1 Tax=Trichocoleus desertorum TaxID=1481672 RepID=UPI003297465E
MGNANNQWLQRAEYASLLTSAIGTVAAAVSQQVVFAAAPLSMSLALNTLNRERLQKQSQRDTQAAITQVDTQVQKRFDGVQQQLQALPSVPDSFDPTDIHAQLIRTQEAIANLQKDAEDTVSEVHRHVDGQIKSLSCELQDKLAQIPSPFQPDHLEEDLKQVGASVAQLSQQIAAIDKCLTPLKAIDLAPLRADIAELQSSAKNQTEQSELQRELLKIQLEKLEQHIAQLENANQTVITPQLAELASRLSPTISMTVDLSEKLNRLSEDITSKASMHKISELNNAIAVLQKQIKELPSPVTPFDPATLWEGINSLKIQADSLEEKIGWTQVSIDALDVDRRVNKLKTKIQEIEEKSQQFLTQEELLPWEQRVVNKLTEEITSLQRQLNQVSQEFAVRPEQHSMQALEEVWQKLEGLSAHTTKVSELESELSRLQELIGHANQVTDIRVSELQVLFAGLQSEYKYKLVCDRLASREYLIDALDICVEHLVMICPWLTCHSIDSTVIQKLNKALKRGVKVYIGWGHLKDIKESGNCTKKFRAGLKTNGFYDALYKLEKLQEDFPNEFQLKLLGTHEKFLVCDRKFAMVGSHNFLTSKAILKDGPSKEREVGLYTTDPRIINGLIKRFEDAENLEVEQKHVSSIRSFQDNYFHPEYYEKHDAYHS